jgi:hypothetical protein
VARETNLARLRAFALVGARARLEELKKEEAALRGEFPELFRGGTGAAPKATRKRSRRAMSAAQKKAVSDRMKKYWAERRKAVKK